MKLLREILQFFKPENLLATFKYLTVITTLFILLLGVIDLAKNTIKDDFTLYLLGFGWLLILFPFTKTKFISCAISILIPKGEGIWIKKQNLDGLSAEKDERIMLFSDSKGIVYTALDDETKTLKRLFHYSLKESIDDGTDAT